MTKTAVIIPCYNEEKAISIVVSECKKYLPEADIYVYDNNSKDNTAKLALEAGAIVRTEPRQGKGNVIRRMFADIDADVYVMTDGDATYDISRVPELINILKNENLDMVIGARKESEEDCYRSGHKFGNWLLTSIVKKTFNYDLKDMLSGLRIFSRRFAKTFPSQSKGFEIETELTIYALSERLPIKEVYTDYFARPEGSFSKLSTYQDGIKILKTIILLIRDEKPFLFFSFISLLLLVLSIILSIPLFVEFLKSGTVPRFPTAILVTGIVLCSFFSFLAGFMLDSIANFKKENRRRDYLKF